MLDTLGLRNIVYIIVLVITLVQYITGTALCLDSI
jgi:hypothetical protein